MSCLPKWCTVRRKHTNKEKAQALAKKQHEYSLMNEEENESHQNQDEVSQSSNQRGNSLEPMLNI